MRIGFLLLAALLPGCAHAASLTTLGSWPSTAGSVYGKPVVMGGVVYGVLGNTLPPNGSVYTGSVWSLTPSGTSYTAATVSSFSGGAGGGNPVGGLTADAAGNLYGAAYSGGSSASTCTGTQKAGCGLIYKLSNAGGSWTRTTIYTFAGGADGIGPLGSMIMDAAGNLYGVTAGGGSGGAAKGCAVSLSYPIGCGTVFKLSPPASGTTWTETILYAFKGTAGVAPTVDGDAPVAPLVLDQAGNIYGVTQFGGTKVTACGTLPTNAGDGYCGTIFKLTPPGSGTLYTETILHQFTDAADGSIPSGGLAADAKGNLYGTALQGSPSGTAYEYCYAVGYSGCGQVFELSKASAYATKSVVRYFTGADGENPAGFTVTGRGRVIGVNTYNSQQQSCGSSEYYCGSVWMETPTATAWHETVLRSFAGGTGLAGPEFGVTFDTNGKIYGVSQYNTTSSAFMLTGATP